MCKVHTTKKVYLTNRHIELLNITNDVKNFVKESGINNGQCTVFSMHTTTALLINENEPGLEEDIPSFLKKIVPYDDNYHHHHYYSKDGRMAVNAWAHLRSILLGLSVTIPVINGELALGGRENIYLVELDGPQKRTVIIQVIGAGESKG
ncbi:MAG: YjbQ family protein [Thermoprotei archaeon]|nr:MAG: YjbQ family protein [Thermoprotei archaeon]